MLKTIALIKRRDDVSREAFREHYENVHAPLALGFIRSMSRYLRNHVAEEIGGGDPGFDCATEFWYPGGAEVRAVFELLDGPRGEAIRRDELTFMDKPRNTFFAVEERPVLGPEPASGEALKVLALAKRRPGAGRERFLADWDAALRELLGGPRAPLACTRNDALPGEEEPAYDCAAALWYDPASGLPAGLADWRPDAERLVLVRVSECETPPEKLGPEAVNPR